MRIAITGPLGHIGSRFIHSLAPGQFDDVLLVDDMSAQRYCSLFELPRGVKFELVEADVTNPKCDLAALFKGRDCVIHLAAITNAAASFDAQQDVERVNFVGTERVAEACLAVGARCVPVDDERLWHAGRGRRRDVHDRRAQTAEPVRGEQARAEALLQEVAAERGLRTIICRFGTIFGRLQGHAVPHRGQQVHLAGVSWPAAHRVEHGAAPEAAVPRGR